MTWARFWTLPIIGRRTTRITLAHNGTLFLRRRDLLAAPHVSTRRIVAINCGRDEVLVRPCHGNDSRARLLFYRLRAVQRTYRLYGTERPDYDELYAQQDRLDAEYDA